MPELPDLQVAKEYVDATSLHREIVASHIDAEHELADGLTPQAPGATLAHRTLASTHRHGKQLFLELGDGGPERWLRVHLGMSGSLRAWDGDRDDDPGYIRLRLDFDDGRRLAFRCPRRLGTLELVDDPAAWVEAKGLGPDPWQRDDPSFLGRCLEGRRGQIKPTLMNQEVVAGLGNVYVDEILFREGIHPTTSVPRLRDGDDDGDGAGQGKALEALHETTQWVLTEATREYKADPRTMPDEWLLSDRSEGRECPRCGGRIEKAQVGGRSTYFCEGHQPE